jgi:PAS domain-containing protein
MSENFDQTVRVPVNLLGTKQFSEEQLRKFIEFAPNALLVLDQNASIILVNDEAEGLLGYRREALLSQNFEVLVPHRLRDPLGPEKLMDFGRTAP